MTPVFLALLYFTNGDQARVDARAPRRSGETPDASRDRSAEARDGEIPRTEIRGGRDRGELRGIIFSAQRFDLKRFDIHIYSSGTFFFSRHGPGEI